jgi:uncharacterized protein YecE (DUF72 family)
VKKKVYIGMGGWELPSFNTYFYPARRTKGFRKLEFYSRYFDCVEVNSTFYNTSLHHLNSRRWIHDVSGNPEFLFIVKLYRGFTHTFDATRNDVVAVHRLLEPLASEKKFAGLIMQFPYSFTNLKERRDYVVQLARIFKPHRVFVEVRHSSWNHSEIVKLFEENEINPVNVDLPQIKNHMPPTNLAFHGVSFFRMMGRNWKTWDRPWRVEDNGKYIVSDRYHYMYSSGEIHELFRRIDMVKTKADSTFVVFHNDPQAHSLVNGFQLRHMVEKHRTLPPNHDIKSLTSFHPVASPSLTLQSELLLF